MNYKLSLIIPTYNNGNYLEKLIPKLLKSNYNYELIVIDDGSSDNTKNILDNFKDDKLKVIYLGSNHGVAYARNIGLDSSTGDYITFLDSDDELIDNYYEYIFKYLNNNYDVICYGTRMIYEDHESDYSMKLIGDYSYEDFIKEKLYLSIPFINWITNKVFKKEVINTIRFDTSYKSGEDLKFITDIFKNIKNYYFLNEVMYLYNRMNNNSITRNDTSDLVETVNRSITNVHNMITTNNLDITYFNEYKKGMYEYTNNRIINTIDNEELKKSLLEKNSLMNGSE